MLTKELTFRGKSFKIAYRDDIPQHPSWYSFDDEISVREANWNISPGDVVLDIGAAYGSYTTTALVQGASYVCAWSPQGRPGEETEAETLRQTLALNRWSNRCHIIESGVYDRDGWLNTMTQEFHTSEPAKHNDIIKVSTMDSWMSTVDLQRIDWMKLDVEGAEPEVLKGARNLISKFKPKIQIENHIFKRASLYDEVRDLLTSGALGVKYKEISTIKYHAISHSLYHPILDEIQPIEIPKKKLRCAFFFPTAHMRMPIDVNNIWTADRGLTGSEMTFIMYALEISKRGHEVTMFTSITRNAELERVVFCPYNEWASIYKDQHWDALCSWMTPEPLKIANPSQFRLFDQQVTDFSLCEPGWESYVDVLTPVSHSHANFMKSATSLPLEKWKILYNGVNTSDFKPKEKVPGKMIWASSHDRGLHWILEAFPKIKKAVPHATLHIFYNFSGLEGFARLTNATGFMAELANRSRYTLEAMRRLEGKGIFTYKSVSRQRIQEEMATSEILAYPCDPVRYTEAFGVTVLEACAAGTVPVICTADAFDELWGSVGLNVSPPFVQHKDEYVEKVIRVLKDEKLRQSLSDGCREYARKFEWSTLADGLEKCLLTRGQEGLSLVKWDQK